MNPRGGAAVLLLLAAACLATAAGSVDDAGSCGADAAAGGQGSDGTCTASGAHGKQGGDAAAAAASSHWEMTATEFEQERRGNAATSLFVMWHSPGCGFCRRLSPDFEAVAAAVDAADIADGRLRVVKIDATANRELAGQFGIKGYPTLHLFQGGESEGAGGDSHTQSPIVCPTRSRRGMTAFLNEHIPGLDLATPVDAASAASAIVGGAAALLDATSSFDALVYGDATAAKDETGGGGDIGAGGRKHTLVLWRSSSKQSDLAAPEFERVARWYNGQADGVVAVAAVSAEDRQDLLERYGIDHFPTITLHTASDGAAQPPHEYDIDFKNVVVSLSSVKIAEFVKSHTKAVAGPALPPSPTETCTADVDVLVPDTFDTYVQDHPHTLVEFYAPWCGHCKKFAPELNRLARAFKSNRAAAAVVGVAAVDADEHRELADRFEVNGYPTLIYFGGSTDAREPYSGEKTQTALAAFLNAKAGTTVSPLVAGRESAAIEATAETLDELVLNPSRDVLVLFYAPWCPHCKKAVPEFHLLAESLARAPEANVSVVMLDAVAHKDAARRWGGTHRYPTVEFFPRGDKSGLVPWVYMAPITADHMLAYIDEQTGGNTVLCAGPGERSGVVDRLEPAVRDAWASGDFAAAATAAAALADAAAAAHPRFDLRRADAAIYAKILGRMQQRGPDYADTELRRLGGMLSRPGLAVDKRSSMTRRSNVLRHILLIKEQ